MNYLLQIQASADKSNFMGISYDALLTGLIPIIIFIVAYIFKKQNENNKEIKRIKELEEYLKSSIEILKKPLFRQTETLIELSHSLREKKEKHLYLNHIASFHVEQIKEINSNDLYKIFIKNKKGSIADKTQLYGKFRASVDYIGTVKKSISDDFSMLSEKVERNQEDFRYNLEITDEAFYNMISQNQNISIEQDPFLSRLQEITFNWHSLENDDINYRERYIAKEKYIEPLIELCAQNIRDHRSAFILKHIQLCIYAFNDIEELKKVFRSEFLLTARRLQNSWFEINSALKKFYSM